MNLFSHQSTCRVTHSRWRHFPAGCLLLRAMLVAPAAAQLPPPSDDGSDVLQRTQDAIERLVAGMAPSMVAVEVQSPPGVANAAGSGFVVRADGLILTSEHVLSGALSIHVTLHNGRSLRAQRVAADARCDLAVIRIDARDLTPVSWGDSQTLRSGSMVFAFGNPLGLAGDGHSSVSLGLVSAIARPLPEAFGIEEDRYYGEMIQTTAPIAPGFSGGPLLDIHGHVVGILTANAPFRDANDSMGFAMPIHARTRPIIDALIDGRSVEYGYLGVQVRNAGQARFAVGRAAAAADQPDVRSAAGRGAEIQFVFPEGPADKAGLQAGDVITAVDDAGIDSADQMVQILGSMGPDKDVRLTFRRETRRREATARLVRRLPASGRSRKASPRREWNFRGATLGPASAVVREQVGAPEGALWVLLVSAGSAADRAGLAPGDIIVRIDGRTVTLESGERLAGISGDCLLGLANGGSVLLKVGM